MTPFESDDYDSAMRARYRSPRVLLRICPPESPALDEPMHLPARLRRGFGVIPCACSFIRPLNQNASPDVRWGWSTDFYP